MIQDIVCLCLCIGVCVGVLNPISLILFSVAFATIIMYSLEWKNQPQRLPYLEEKLIHFGFMKIMIT